MTKAKKMSKEGVVMRLTEKKENGFYELKEGNEIYGEEHGIRLVQIVGKYEDIEEELGIGLLEVYNKLKEANEIINKNNMLTTKIYFRMFGKN